MRKATLLSARLLIAAAQKSSAGPELAKIAAASFGNASVWGSRTQNFHTSLTTWDDKTPATSSPAAIYKDEEPKRKFGTDIATKELWHECWMYEDRFGTSDDPVVVPSLEPERVMGCTDPDDDNLVIWGILREGEPPKQFVQEGEYYQLKRVSYVKRVGDVLMEGQGESKSIPQ